MSKGMFFNSEKYYIITWKIYIIHTFAVEFGTLVENAKIAMVH
jgi:hypothetical protein